MALAHICLKSSSASCLSLSLALSSEEDEDSVEDDIVGTRGHPKTEKTVVSKFLANLHEGEEVEWGTSLTSECTKGIGVVAKDACLSSVWIKDAWRKACRLINSGKRHALQSSPNTFSPRQKLVARVGSPVLSPPSAGSAFIRRGATWQGSQVCNFAPAPLQECLTELQQLDCHLCTSMWYARA